MDKTLYICIGCDTDPDRPGFIDGVDSEKLSWRGMEEGIPLVKELVRDVVDDNNNPPIFTWLVRADEQIKTIYGSYSWVLENYKNFLDDLLKSGDEIGWHPHLYKYDHNSNSWYQDISDFDFHSKMLKNAYSAFNKIFPDMPKAVRMGWDYHNNITMKTLSESGILIDFSALPGLRIKPGKEKTKRYNAYDWFDTPIDCYHPSENDYRRSATENEKSLSILEAPVFMTNSLLWGLIAGLQFARKMKDVSYIFQSIKKPAYTINITGAPRLFSPILNELQNFLMKSKNNQNFFITYFHPDELLDNKSNIYKRCNLKCNLISIKRLCAGFGVRVEHVGASDLVNFSQKPELL